MTKIGVLLPSRESVMYDGGSGDPRPLVALARQAEEVGFDSIWVGDSLLAKPRSEPLTLLAGVATATSDVLLGTAVLLSSQRNPEQLAQATATLDALSGGRFVLGIGAGPGAENVRADHEFVGANFDRRGSRSIEVVERVRSLWRGDDGVQMYPLPGRAGGPPIWIGGSGPRTLERVARVADGWFPIAPFEHFQRDLASLRDAVEMAGRSVEEVTVCSYLTVVIGDKEDAERQLAEHSELYYGAPHATISRIQASTAGPLDDVGEWLQTFIDAGSDHLCVRFGFRDVAGQIEALAPILAQLKT